jgi:hypothetical protein
VRRLALALAAAVLVLVIAGAAFPSGSAQTWQWQTQAAPSRSETFRPLRASSCRRSPQMARHYLSLDGATARELPLSTLGAFAVGDLSAAASIELQAVAADGSTLGRSTLPATSASCNGTTAACASQAQAGTTVAYAVVESHSRGLTHDRLTRIDTASLNPVGRSLLLGSSSAPPVVGAVALSPDQTRIAFARGHGGTISVVDLASMRIAKAIQTRAGIDVRSLAWLDDNELALIGQRMSRPYAREVTGRWLIRVHVDTRVSVALSLTKKATLQYSQRAGSRLISVLRPNRFRDPTRTVAVSDADGQTSMFRVTLPAPSPTLFEDRPVASADGTHLYIVRTGGQVIDVDLATQKWVVHQVTAPADAPTKVPVASALRADATPNGLVVYGFFTFQRGGHAVFRSGIYRIDTASWTATTLDATDSDFLVYGDKIAMFGRASLPFPMRKNAPAVRGTGIEVVSAASGQRVYHLFGGRAFSGVVVIGRFGHALRQQALPGVPYGILDRRFDAASGASTGTARPPLSALRLIYRGSQAIGESGAAAAATPTPTRASSAAPAALPRAFGRPATPLDALPATAPFRSGLPGRGGAREQIIAARRIASYTDGRGRRALLYLLRSSYQVCEFTLWQSGAGGGCNPAANFFAGRHVVVGSGRLVTGVADDDVATVVVVGSRGVRHRVALTDDGGFIYDCRAYSGCTCVVDHVEVFDSAGQKIESDRVGGTCRKRRTTQGVRASGAFTISNRGRPVPLRGTLGFPDLHPRPHTFLLGSIGATSFYRVQVALHYTCWGSGPRETIGKIGVLGCPNLVGAYPLQLEDTIVTQRRGQKTPHYLRFDGIVADQVAAVGLEKQGKIVEQVGVTTNLYAFTPPYPSGIVRVVALDAHGKPLAARVGQGEHQSAPRGLFGPRAAKTTAAQLRHVVQRGEARGVSVEVGANSVVVFDLHRIDPAISAALGGGRASFSCFQVKGQNVRQNRSAGISAPLGPSVAFKISGIAPQYDGCEIGGSYGHRWPDRFGSHSILEVALTPQGNRYFEDRATARDLAAFVRSSKTQSIRRKLGSSLRAAVRAAYGDQVVLLDSASASAPSGRIGVWTTGGRTTFSERSHLGDRFYVEFEHSKLVRENVRGLAFVF